MKYRALVGGNRGDRRFEEGEVLDDLSKAEVKGLLDAGIIVKADD